MRKQTANIITSCRILFSICLLLCPVFSVCFYCLYLFCGFTDMVDGTIARKTNAVSRFGAKLDTIADFIFFAVALIKLLPVIHIPKWIWTWTVVIAIIKIFCVILGFIYRKKLIFLHTVMNKITGFLLFLLPLSLQFAETKYSLTAICIVATFAAIQEVSLLSLNGTATYLQIAYYAIVISVAVYGILILAFQNCQKMFWVKNKEKISLILNVFAVLLFIISSQPYAGAFLFIFLIIKVLMLVKWQ